jgi:hypothetical protein
VSEPPHPLNRPLPPDVAAGESAFIQFYQKYTVFSWPWAWRRTALFGSFGVLAGVSFGASHGLFVRDLGEGVAVSLACSLSNLVLIGAGPMLAAFFRHRGWPRNLERTLVVASIVAGVVLGALADEWASDFHDRLMATHGHHGASPAIAPAAAAEAHALMRRLLALSRDLLLLFIACGGFALPAYFSERKRWAEHHRRAAIEKMSLDKNEADLRLTLLQAQVEPHFLFNTLASVRSLVTTDPARAAQTIDALASHLRATLPKFRAEPGVAPTLAEQFAICGSYLELMKLRMGDRLTVELDLPAALADAPFPPLLLISLVENAIKHGVEPKPGVTKVSMSARALERDRLEVCVADDGAGLALGMGEGTGLANIRAQLLTRFGAAASLELSAHESGGVLARLVVPRETRA